MTRVGEQQREWPFLRASLVAVSALLLLELVGTAVDKRLNPAPSALARTVKCLRNEKGLAVEIGALDPIGKTADGGVVRTLVETNSVTIVISSSDTKAKKLGGYYLAVNSGPEASIQLWKHDVFVWERPPSPTQKQTLYDCYY
jgi:hypothetical protein